MARGFLTSLAAILLLIVALSATAAPFPGATLFAAGATPDLGALVIPPLEPATAMLQALGLTGLAALGSRRRRPAPGPCRTRVCAAPSATR